MSNKRSKKPPLRSRCSCGRLCAVGFNSYLAPHVTPSGRPCLMRLVLPRDWDRVQAALGKQGKL